MRKSKKQIEQVAQAFKSEMSARFPYLRQDVHLEEWDGYHAWVDVRIPTEQRSHHNEILRASVEITDQLWDTGVWVLGLVIQEREPVHG